MLFYLSRLKSLQFCYFEGLKMDFLQFQYFQFTKTGFSPLKNFKNVIRRSEIVESCYFYEKIKKQPLLGLIKIKKQPLNFLVTQKSGFYKFSDNPGHKYLRLVHILNEFFFHHKQSKGISNDIESS